MTIPPDERGKNYIARATGDTSEEEPQKAREGLDFLAEERVNPEDLTGGTPKMHDLESDIAIAETAKAPLTSIAGLEHLFDPPTGKRAQAVKKPVAVMYLRVSTSRQTHTGADVDEDGNSIATQREHTIKKGQQLRATILREFVEPGASARSIAKRPVFREMLRFIDEHPEVTHIIAYQRSRMFRSVADSAIVESALAEQGIEIVSAKEDYGKGADGMVMKTITDAFNQWQSQKNGEDISLKMEHKVEQGGTVGRAKLGYLNIRKEYEGRLVNSIDTDPIRAPLIKWAFEEYATGEYSVMQLQSALDDRGLTSRPSARFKQAVVSTSQLAQILRDPYYTGVIRYKGKLHAGRHEPLISKETFLQVQEILDLRNRRGDRDRVHFHYLKGALYCGHCRDEGRTSRLVYSQNKGNGGIYEYFVCAAKSRGLCRSAVVRVDTIERKLLALMHSEGIPSEQIEALREDVLAASGALHSAEKEMKANLRRTIAQLDAQEERLIDAIADGRGATQRLKERLDAIAMKRSAMQEKLGQTERRLELGIQKMLAYLELLERCGSAYERTSDSARRQLLNLFFSEIFVWTTDVAIDMQGERSAINRAFREAAVEAVEPEPINEKAPRDQARGFLRFDAEASLVSLGLNKTILVAGTGFEPATSGL